LLYPSFGCYDNRDGAAEQRDAADKRRVVARFARIIVRRRLQLIPVLSVHKAILRD
jgi:hypothetical protein